MEQLVLRRIVSLELSDCRRNDAGRCGAEGMT